MSDQQDSGKRYEVVPARMVLPTFPQLPTDNLSQALAAAGSGQTSVQALQEVGWKTVVGNIQAADARTGGLIEECRRRIGAQQPWALVELLDQYPGLLEHEWVRSAMAALIRTGEFRRRRGRPHSRYKIHPLVVIAMVEALIKAGEAAYPEKAFFALEGYGVLSCHEATRLYYQGLREERFKPIFMTFESHKREISEEEYERQIAGARRLELGRPVRYPIEHPLRGKGELVVEAVD